VSSQFGIGLGSVFWVPGVQLLPAAFGREDLAGDSGEELNRYKDCDKIMQLRKNTENRLHSRYGSRISTVYD